MAPLDVCCHDANKDYVVVTWKQPAVEGSSSILGYYIDRWVQRTVDLLPRKTAVERCHVDLFHRR